jgi:hypothetical protein
VQLSPLGQQIMLAIPVLESKQCEPSGQHEYMVPHVLVQVFSLALQVLFRRTA